MNPSQLLHLALLGVGVLAVARGLPRWAMERPVTLGVVLAALGIFGAAALLQLPVELMPNASYGSVTVFVDVRGGMPPPEVERLITRPVEEAMGTVSRLRNLTSSSKKDRSVVTLEFDPGTDMDLAALEVREKFLRIKHRLPKDIEKPIVARYEESDSPVVIAALTSPSRTPEELRRLVEEGLKDQLLRVEGVANVEVGGGRERKIVVNMDRYRMAAAGVPIQKAVGVLEQNNLNLRTGQVAQGESLTLGVRAVGAFRTLDEIGAVTLVIDKNGGRVRLRDVAEVADSFLEPESYSRLDAQSAVTVYVQKESTANTVKVAGDVAVTLEGFRRSAPRDVQVSVISDQRQAILASIEAVRVTMVYGVALVVLVLPLFLAKTPASRGAAAAGLCVLALLLGLNGLGWAPTLVAEIAAAGVAGGMLALSFWRPDLRSAGVVALSVPVSVCVTLALMFVEGVSINVMSLSGLVLGMGLLVDNAVVVMENYDRLCRDKPSLSRREAMVEAAREMEGPMVGGTLTTVVVFLPFSLLAKQTQLLFSGIAFTVTASLFASLFVSLSLVPALGALVDPHAAHTTAWDDWVVRWWGRVAARWKSWRWPQGLRWSSLRGVWVWVGLGVMVWLLGPRRWEWVAWVTGLYALLAGGVVAVGLRRMPRYAERLTAVLARPGPMFLGVAFLFLAALSVFVFFLPKDLMASSEQSEFVVFVELDTGVRLDISNTLVQEVEKAVRDFAPTRAAIKNVSSKVEGWSSKVYVTLNDRSHRRETTQEIIDKLRPEVDRVIEPYAKPYKAFCYFSEPRMGKELFVEIFGRDYDVMAQSAIELAGRLGKLPGLSDVKIRYRPGRPQISVIVDPVRAALFGLETQGIAETLHAQMRGLRATAFYDKAQEVETVVRLKPDQRETLDQMKNLLFTTPLGATVPLIQLAHIEGDLSPSEIWHRNRSRMIQVSANLGAMSLETAATEVKKVIRGMKFPLDTYADIGGQYEDLIQANSDFWRAMVLTLFLVFMVMACQFESYLQPFVIMATVPLSLIGAVAALGLSGATVTLGVSVGLLMLGGIEVNKGIMLVDRVHLLQADHPGVPLSPLLVSAARQRLRPIFMTTVTTVLGLVPMALDRSESAVLWAPLAVTVIGGLISSTVLTVFVVPALYAPVSEAIPRLKRLALRGKTWAERLRFQARDGGL